ncbi:HDOD domain-containing protein [Pseudoalteromonas xiamenensis]|uniref:HDOD domain-containing protein n=1 Tax=Pseudoalteromonas xiamenensis TaxID=882626 RepID=UPI003CC79A14
MISVDEKILKDIKEGFNIPPKPELLTALQHELAQAAPELNQVAKLIANDVATSAAVLKVINSPCYGLARTITDIRQAVMFLGNRQHHTISNRLFTTTSIRAEKMLYQTRTILGYSQRNCGGCNHHWSKD